MTTRPDNRFQLVRLKDRTVLRYLASTLLKRAAGLTSLRLQPREERYFLGAVIRAKNESRFLPELIAHHHILGVEHFYIYDNNSSDDLEGVLSPFVRAGLVTLVHWEPTPASPGCYVHLFENYAAECHWLAFIDADEFIVEKSPGLLLEALRNRPSLSALALNWRYFGSSGHVRLPEGLVIENFRQANHSVDYHVKVVARPTQITHYYNSHNFIYKDSFARTLSGSIVLGSRSFVSADDEVSINHYVYRSKENYLYKTNLGYVDSAAASGRRASQADTEFSKHNDRTIDHPAEMYAEGIRGFLVAHGYGAPYV